MNKNRKEQSKAGTVGLIILAALIVLTLLGMAGRCAVNRRPDTPAPPEYNIEITFPEGDLEFGG